MIELLLEAERSLSMGRFDEAGRLYRLVADADPHDAIALVGLARVAAERADDTGALVYARRALALDPENTAAGRLVERLTDLAAERGSAPPERGTDPTDASPSPRRGLFARFRREP